MILLPHVWSSSESYQLKLILMFTGASETLIFNTPLVLLSVPEPRVPLLADNNSIVVTFKLLILHVFSPSALILLIFTEQGFVCAHAPDTAISSRARIDKTFCLIDI